MDKVKEITDKIMYATLATVDESGRPWNSPVWSLHDKDYTYYWCSWKENQHSQNISANGQVFIVIYDSTVPEGTGEGVYIQTHASEILDSTEISTLLAHPETTWAAGHEVAEFQGENPRRWYKAVPEKIWLNKDGDVSGSFVDIREQVL